MRNRQAPVRFQSRFCRSDFGWHHQPDAQPIFVDLGAAIVQGYTMWKRAFMVSALAVFVALIIWVVAGYVLDPWIKATPGNP